MRRKRIDPYAEQILRRAEYEIAAYFMDFTAAEEFLETFAQEFDKAANNPDIYKPAGRGAKVFFVKYRGFEYGVIFLHNDKEIYLSDIFNSMRNPQAMPVVRSLVSPVP
jgi:hypothetical protein